MGSTEFHVFRHSWDQMRVTFSLHNEKVKHELTKMCILDIY